MSQEPSTCWETNRQMALYFIQNFDRPDVVKLRASGGGDPRKKRIAGERKRMDRKSLQSCKAGAQPLLKEVMDAIQAAAGLPVSNE